MADLNAIANGVNSETGEYLTPQERKSLFKKGRMKSNINVGSFRSGIAGDKKSGGGGVNGGLVKITQPPTEEISSIVPAEKGDVQKEEQSEENTRDFTNIKEKIIEVESVFKKLVTIKSEKKRLHEKYLDSVQPISKAKTAKKQSGSMPMSKTISKGITKASFNVFGMLGDLLQYYVLSWIGDPKNKKIVETFTTIFKHVASFFNWFVTGVVNNLLTGFAELVGGDSILEKIGGFFKLIFGVVGLRWLLNPLKILKDLKSIFKFGKKFTKIFKGIFKLGDKGLKNSFGGILKLAGKAFRKTLGRMIQRVLLKVFGKAITKGMVAVTKIVVKKVSKVVRKIPAIGPLIAIAVDLAFGAPIDEALVRAGGALLGGALGAIITGSIGAIVGSVVPVVGNLLLGKAAGTIGGILGSFAGEWIAVSIYKGVKGLFGGKKEEKKEDTPELASGGVVSGPEKGFLAILHGTEAVIPIAKIPEILTLPFKVLGSKILGSIFAVIDSMGSVGRFVKPIAVGVLAPAMKSFGSDKAVADREVGQTQGSSETIKNKINNEREKQDLDKMFGKNIFKEIGEMLLIGGGSIFGPLFGGPAQAKQSDPSNQRPSTGDTPPGAPSPGQASGAVGADKLYKSMGFSEKDWNIYRNTVAKIESGGKYDISGGSGDHYDGRYQLGAAAKTDGSRYAGVTDPGHGSSARESFRKNPELQEKIFSGFTKANHTYLMGLPEYRDATPQRKLQILGYAHNQGMGGAANWMKTGVVGADGFGTKGTKYTDALAAEFKKQKTVQTTQQSAAASPSATPGQNLTPEQKSSMFQKSGMSAMAANALSSVSTGVEREPDTSGAKMLTGTNKGPVPPVTPQATISKNTQTSAMIPMSNSFSIDKKMQSRQTNNQSIIAAIKRGDNYNVMNTTSMNLNNTSGLSETLVLNRI